MPTNDNEIPTPRTDEAVFTINAMPVYVVDADFARTLERENIQLREELRYCRTKLESVWLPKDQENADKLKQDLSDFKQVCGELLDTLKGIHVFGVPDSTCIICQTIIRAEQLLKEG